MEQGDGYLVLTDVMGQGDGCLVPCCVCRYERLKSQEAVMKF